MNTMLPILSLANLEPTGPVEEKPSLKLDPRTYDRALSCVHCGLCLPACPTYVQTGHEAESPRGRIQLMRAVSDGQIAPSREVKKHLDSCLDCRGCETACPSGVVYHELIEETRDRLARYEKKKPSPYETWEPAMKWFLLNVMTRPRRLKLAVLPVRLLQKAKVYSYIKRLRVMELLPPPLQKMEQLLPEDGPLWPSSLPEMTGAAGMDAMIVALRNSAWSGGSGTVRDRVVEIESRKNTRQTVGFFAGCVGSIMFDTVNRQAIELIAACGVDVYAPSHQGCCGAMHQHDGAIEQARELARRNIDLFLPRDGRMMDYIVTNIAGCGASLHEYDTLLRDDRNYAARAREFVRRVRDISQLLTELPLPELKHPVNLTVTYHDACHLAHAQKITTPPRALLQKIPGLTLVPLAESDLCCGAAGTYNLTHPVMAASLADRKLANVAATGAGIIVTGNVGCAMHLKAQAKTRGRQIEVMHPVQLLHRAVFGEKSGAVAA